MDATVIEIMEVRRELGQLAFVRLKLAFWNAGDEHASTFEKLTDWRIFSTWQSLDERFETGS